MKAGTIMKNAIQNPKVFISYAWGSDDYQQKVMDFASRLTGDGIKVIIDKWSMEPGNDTIHFMEKSVKDPDIHFVLILLDEIYAKKADNRAGGVGTETQIISAEVYSNVEQSKFVPVIFERNANGEVCKPVYLKTRFYIDLTTDRYEEEYKRLVRHLYGQKTYAEPELGKMPEWVKNPSYTPPISISEIQLLKNGTQLFNRKATIRNAFDKIYGELKKNIKPASELPQIVDAETAPIIVEYRNSFSKVRDYYLELLDCVSDDENIEDIIVKFWSKIQNECLYQCSHECDLNKECVGSFLQEIVIYSVAKWWRNEYYGKIRNILTRPYYIITPIRTAESNFVEMFYSSYFDMLDNAKNMVDGQQLLSGETKLWIETLNEKYGKNEIIFADLLIFNLTILFPLKLYPWFPKTYIYADNSFQNQDLKVLAFKIKSKFELKKMFDLFLTDNPEEIKKLFKNMDNMVRNGMGSCGYSRYYTKPQVILEFIKLDEIGSQN